MVCAEIKLLGTYICEMTIKASNGFEIRLSSRSKISSQTKYSIKVFHKLFTIQESQYCQLCFSCAIRKELDQ